ncbi:MAG: NAD(P)/FAD-dependent oxidoreductase [Clostridiales bacterium]|nr:NAD(P)/FAD-dependent oxidoreductase [Clostridiales bacterium]
MKGKVVVAGAGLGGLFAAELLGKAGCEVTVYERAKDLDSMRYDWHDDVAANSLESLGLEMPKESWKKADFTFVSPYEGAMMDVTIEDESKKDISVERRPLNKMLYDRAAKYANIVFDANVEGPIFENGKVSGIIINGKEERADLVIDSTGVESPLREKVGLGDAAVADPKTVFYAYRAFYKRNPEAEIPKKKSKVYMKHLGEDGLSWCICDHNPDLVNVLVGRVVNLSEEQLKRALDDLKKLNPVLTDEIKRGGMVCKIPVRYPLTKMVTDGYAAIGDCAFMTIPMLGSGIVSSLKAAKLLAEAVINAKDASKEELYTYQVKVFNDFGAEHCAVDTLKRFLLSCTPDEITFLFGSGVLSEADLQSASGGGTVKMTPSALIEKLKAGRKNLPFLIRLAGAVSRSEKASKTAKKIPSRYDEAKIEKWSRKLEKLVNGL